MVTGLLRRARERADALGIAVAVSLTVALPPLEPLHAMPWPGDLGENDAVTGDNRFYLSHPGGETVLAAWGVGQLLEADGATRFTETAQALREVCANALGEGLGGATPLPLHAVGGFSFFDRLDSPEWPGFTTARLVVPATLIRRHGGECAGQITLMMPPGGEVEPASRTMLERLGALHAACVQAAPAQPEGGNGNGGRANGQEGHGYTVQPRPDGPEQWPGIVEQARQRIAAGELRKVVLARAMDLECAEAPDPRRMMERLVARHPGCFCFMVDQGEGTIFLGASPERLARFENGVVEMDALAGTAPRGAEPAQDEALAKRLGESHKELDEHRTVIEDIAGALEELGQVDFPPKPTVRRFESMHHLHTPMRLTLKGEVAPLLVLERLHPSAAVGGLPRDRAFEVIRSVEAFERGWYGAPVGWLDASGRGEFCVALRSGTLRGNHLRLFAGGGIMVESDPMGEYEETRIKFRPLLGALSQA